MDDRQLRWVQQARRVGDRTAALGPLAAQLVQSLGRGASAWRQRLIGILDDELGPQFLDHAEPAAIARGVLTFHVSDAAMAYTLRMQWEQRLLELLRARLPESGIHTIRFIPGK